MVDGVNHVFCDSCDGMVPATTQKELPDDGSELHLSGWYGGFTDMMMREEEHHLILCHDCSLAVWRAVPKLAKLRGLHPTVDDVACCEFHWTTVQRGDDRYIVYGDGSEKKLRRLPHGGFGGPAE